MAGTAFPGLALAIARLTPTPVEPRATVSDIQQLRDVLAAVADEQSLALAAEINGGSNGMLIVHLTGDRAWVTYLESDAGGDTYACDPADCGVQKAHGAALHGLQTRVNTDRKRLLP